MGGDFKRAASAVGRAVQPLGHMIKRGVGAVKRAVGQTPPTAQEIRQFLDSKGIGFTQAEQLIKWGVLPHTKFKASELFLDRPKDNYDHWNERLSKFIPDAKARMKFIQPLVQQDIGIWIPLVKESGFQ